ncbi:MAG: type II secretion system protein [Fibrobacter sp.]|nr:type II secretion system protein [Fibrobacter sp.]
MVKVCEHLQVESVPSRKRGFGIVEVLVAAAVLGFLYMAVLNLQGSNRDALLRIRSRDGATEVAQNIIDSLGALGVARLSDASVGASGKISIPNIERVWKGQPGAIDHDMKVVYNAEVTVSHDADYMSNNTTMLQSVQHVYAKRLDVKVSWRFKNSTQSITVSGVIR